MSANRITLIIEVHEHGSTVTTIAGSKSRTDLYTAEQHLPVLRALADLQGLDWEQQS